MCSECNKQAEKMQEILAEEHDDVKKDDSIIDALKELTQAVTKLTVEWEKFRKAGKF